MREALPKSAAQQVALYRMAALRIDTAKFKEATNIVKLVARNQPFAATPHYLKFVLAREQGKEDDAKDSKARYDVLLHRVA